MESALRNRILILVATFACTARSITSARDQGTLGHAIAPDEDAVYGYDLIRSANEPVCHHMQDVYERAFKRPWSFHDYFLTHHPEAMHHFYEPGSGAWSEDETFLWWMRYALHPTSAEFEAVKWHRGVKVADSSLHIPIQTATLDIDNDGIDDLVTQSLFYGFGDGRSATDGFTVESLQRKDGERRAALSGDVIRPFIFQGSVYLSIYEAGGDSESWPLFRHVPPEKMWVKSYIGGQENGQAMNATNICEFDMRRTASPISSK